MRRVIIMILLVVGLVISPYASTDSSEPLYWWKEIVEQHKDDVKEIVINVLTPSHSSADYLNLTMDEFTHFREEILDAKLHEKLLDELGDYWLKVDKSNSTSDTVAGLSDIEQAAVIDYLKGKFPERSFSESISIDDIESIMPDLHERIRQELYEDSFLVLGEPPVDAGKQPEWDLWISDLSNFAAQVMLQDKYYYPKGPVVSHGAEITGYFSVGIDPAKHDQEIVNDLDRAISEIAAEHEIDIPVLFRFSGPPELSGYYLEYDPIPGGVSCASDWDYATLNIAARNTISGHHVSIITSHIGDNGTIPLSSSIGQPSRRQNQGVVDRVARDGGYADAARVTSIDRPLRPGIHIGIGTIIPVHGYGNPGVGQLVYKSGITTRVTSGFVTEINRVVPHPYLGNIRGQISANYHSMPGDSGGPIWFTDAVGTYYAGIHVGRYDDAAYFSPQSGVRNELSVVPLTN
ncbi:MAG: hypothetical protein FH749_14535 [Firmicutes bacterium]|nr:hypothetical protein [Bacillota bacterium]